MTQSAFVNKYEDFVGIWLNWILKIIVKISDHVIIVLNIFESLAVYVWLCVYAGQSQACDVQICIVK